MAIAVTEPATESTPERTSSEAPAAAHVRALVWALKGSEILSHAWHVACNK